MFKQTIKNVLLNPPSPQYYAKRQQMLEKWRYALTGDNQTDPTEVVIQELSEYFKLPPNEVEKRCKDWERYSVEEWQSRERDSSEGLLEFYQTQTSWIFDTMWYHAEQYHERAIAESVEVATGLSLPPHHVKPGHHLDFGAGPGSSSLFFHALGWQVSLADISTTMQDFARWRLARHGVRATFYDTSHEELPAATFDLITAFDVMVHVPDVGETLRRLHTALKPGGYLLFNIDNRPKTLTSEWHLYDEQYPILRLVRSTGFRRYPKISIFHVYQKIERSPANTRLIARLDRIRYNRFVTKGLGNPARRAVRFVRSKLKG